MSDCGASGEEVRYSPTQIALAELQDAVLSLAAAKIGLAEACFGLSFELGYSTCRESAFVVVVGDRDFTYYQA